MSRHQQNDIWRLIFAEKLHLKSIHQNLAQRMTLNRMTLSRMTIIRIICNRMAWFIMTFIRMMLNRIRQDRMTFIRTTFVRMTFIRTAFIRMTFIRMTFVRINIIRIIFTVMYFSRTLCKQTVMRIMARLPVKIHYNPSFCRVSLCPRSRRQRQLRPSKENVRRPWINFSIRKMILSNLEKRNGRYNIWP